MEIPHTEHLYRVDHIYFDQASTNLYNLFLHCEWCGKPIKLVVRTENDVDKLIKWLGGVDNG